MKRKNIICTACCSILILANLVGISGCGKAGVDHSAEVFSTYNTLKVLPSQTDCPDLGKNLNAEMAKGETEGAQLIVKPHFDVKSVILNAGDLINEKGDKFPAENIKIYFQKTINVLYKTYNQKNDKYPVGPIPDMLLPMDKAVEYKENSIKNGENQGFTVEFTTTDKTVAGTYKGEFSLNIDSEITSIPVTLKVHDIDITKTNNHVCIISWGFSSMNGEFNTVDQYEKYYDQAINEYRYTYDFLPGVRYPDRMVENLKKYWDHPHFNTYFIPIDAYMHKDSYLTLQKGELYGYLYAIAQECGEDINYFDKAYILASYVDEPNESEYDAVRSAVTSVYEVEEKLLKDLEKEGFFEVKSEEFHDNFCDKLRKIPVVQTSDRKQMNELGADVNTYCAHINQFETEMQRKLFNQIKEKNANRGAETWYYTCMEPVYPYPTNHIDDNLIGERIMSWMQKDYELDGYLNWSYNLFNKGRNNLTKCDPYTESSRFPDAQGDGYMYYPGAKYGVDGFIPSLRLTTFRDGLEDYDLLCKLDKIAEKKEEFYGIEKGSAERKIFLEELYEKIYSGCIYNEDNSVFYDTRSQLFSILEKQNSATGFLVSNTEKKGEIESNIYLKKPYSLKVNGKELVASECGQGNKFTIVQSSDKTVKLDIEIFEKGKVVENYNIFVTTPVITIIPTKEKPVLRVSADSIIDVVDGKAKITLKSKDFENVNDKIMFEPSIDLSGKDISDNTLDKIADIHFTIKNTSGRKITLKSKFRAGTASYGLLNYDLDVDEEIEITIKDVYSYTDNFRKLKDAVFELYTENVDENLELLPDISFEISDLYYNLKGDNN